MLSFKGVHTSTYGTVLTAPVFIRADRAVNLIKIEGSDRTYREDLGLEPYILKARILLADNADKDAFLAWLSGSGQLILDEDNTKYVTAYIDKQVVLQRLTKGANVKVADVEFLVIDPFRYKLSEANVTLTASGSYTNLGTVYSEPLLKLTGTGTVVLTIGTQSFTYVFDTPYVFVDCKAKDAYHSATYKNRKMTGDFPVLNIGANAISWTGTLTELVITPRTRYL